MFDPAEQCLTSTLFTSSSSHPNSQALKQVWSRTTVNHFTDLASEFHNCFGNCLHQVQNLPPPCAMVMRRDRCNHKFHHTPIAGVEPRACHLSPPFVSWLRLKSQQCNDQSYHSPSKDGNLNIMDPWMRWVSRMG